MSLRGVRYAPSPTGTLHLGNLRTAWISWRLARRSGEPWVVRFEDIDGPRVLPGSQEQQLSDLGALGLVPDEVIVQSQQRRLHFDALLRAVREGHVYPCRCSRKDVAHNLASAPHGPEAVYDGRCRTRPASDFGVETYGWRLRSDDPTQDVLIARAVRGPDAMPVEESFQPAYHWACAIDDSVGRYSLLVRAWDLAGAARAQRAIQQWFAPDRSPPAVFHTSLVVQDDGHRLEKRTQGVTLAEWVASGRSPASLLRAFQATFDESLRSFSEEDPYGETARSLSVSRLFEAAR